MAITLKGFTSYPSAQKGMVTPEVGVNVESSEIEYRPEFKDYLPFTTGEMGGSATAQTMSSGSINGEVLTATGIMALAFATAHTLANDPNGFGQTAGGVYFDSARISQGREPWKSFSGPWTRYTGIL